MIELRKTQNSVALNTAGRFSVDEMTLFEAYSRIKKVKRGDCILRAGEISTHLYFLSSGAAVQYNKKEETVVDLHLSDEWIFNRQSLAEQKPSETEIIAFSDCQLISLSLSALHALISQSQAFLQFGILMVQPAERLHYYDCCPSPAEKYQYLLKKRPQLINIFPIRLIASYLKLAPETLSRVRGRLQFAD